MDLPEKKDLEAKASRVSYLIFKFLQNTLTETEDEELAAWIRENEQNWQLFQKFTSEDFRKKLPR